jgi:O-antigen/teichoic acid export membrane protein
MLIERLKSYLNSEVAGRFYILLSGTFLAQAIGYALAPVLTRLYSPEEMGELNLFLRITGFISAIATLRYEMSLPLPKKDAHAFLLYKQSFKITAYVCATFLVLALLARISYPEWSLTAMQIIPVFVATIFLVVINLGTNWSIRMSEFKEVTRQKLINSIVSNLLKWVFAFVHWGGWGLIIATVIGYVVSSMRYIFGYARLKEKFSGMNSRLKTRVLLKEHRDFPMMNLPIILVDNVRDLLIGAVVFGFYSASIFGSYSHTLAMLSLPIMLVSGSLSQVLFHQLAERSNSGKPMFSFVLKMMGVLVVLSIIPFGTLRFYGQEIFVWVFGSQWYEAGRYAELMTFWLMLNFIFSPLAVVPLVLKKQQYALLFSICSAAIQVGPFVWSYIKGHASVIDFEWSLTLSSDMLALWFVVLLIVYLRWIYRNDEKTTVGIEQTN